MTVNTIAGSKFYICATAQASAPADASAFAALTWVAVGKIGKYPATGLEHNVVTYDTVDTTVSQKGKGVAKATDWEIEVSQDFADSGQDALRTAAATKLSYAVKIERADKLTSGGANSIEYNWGPVGGPTVSGGGPDEPVVQTFKVMTNMASIVVEPS